MQIIGLNCSDGIIKKRLISLTILPKPRYILVNSEYTKPIIIHLIHELVQLNTKFHDFLLEQTNSFGFGLQNLLPVSIHLVARGIGGLGRKQRVIQQRLSNCIREMAMTNTRAQIYVQPLFTKCKLIARKLHKLHEYTILFVQDDILNVNRMRIAQQQLLPLHKLKKFTQSNFIIE
ncbi:hypothetical protein WL99_26210 [Burkholderia cepacia]|nr:hypothetical protein WL99_26210 [Burkholderia cepacia]